MSHEPVVLNEIFFDDDIPDRISCDSGRDIEHPIVIKLRESPSDNPMTVHFSVMQKEYKIIRHMVCKCGKSGHAQVLVQTNLTHEGRSFDVLKVKCPDDDKKVWLVYFDITDIKKYLPSSDKK
jgi:hypothetical protein